MLGLSGLVYLSWWFSVQWLLPGSFNPLASRLAVVGYFLSAFVLTFVSARVRRRSELLFYLGAILLVGHYFYLVHHNADDVNWTVGSYVVVFALSVAVQARRWLWALSAFSLLCGCAVWWLHPSLQNTIFLPGLATILALCVVVLQSRIRLLEGLSESTARFQSLFDATFEGVAVHDRGTIIDANVSFSTMFGYTHQELLGKSLIELSPPDCRARVTSQIRGMETTRYESAAVRKDGTRFAVEISQKPHSYHGRALSLVAVRDVSERQLAEQERLRLTEEKSARTTAQEAVRVRDEFISVASHELRTPITSLSFQLDVLTRHAQLIKPLNDRSELDQFAIRARRQLAKMERLVEELLDVSRMGVGKLLLMREAADLEAIVRDAVDSLSEDLRRAACGVEIRASGAVTGDWDRRRIEQVVENLLRNALTYGAGKPIELVVQGDGRGRAQLAIRDHGIGIEKSLQERVFWRFERGGSGKHYGGLGLGLFIAKQIVEAHQGTMRVESEPGQGATFWVDLPAKPVRAQAAPDLVAQT